MDISEPAAPCNVDVFAGDRDDFVDLDRLAEWRDARLHVIPGADHFFGGAAQRLRETIGEVLSPG